MEHVYETNKEFLDKAPVGTTFHFNTEKFYWQRFEDGWYTVREGKKGISRLITRDWENWKINRITYPSGRTAEQNARIVEALENLLDDAVRQVKEGIPMSGTDENWLQMIIWCFDAGDK